MASREKDCFKIVTVVGARPQFIKAAMVSLAIENHNSNCPPNSLVFSEVIVHTGQHFDRHMSDTFFEELRIATPHYNLGISSSSHGTMTGNMLEKIETILFKETPDLVLVYGDTNSTLAGALAAAKLHIPVGHVEAGLRSFNRDMPEEINRIVTDHVSTLLFCPTRNALQNLSKEGLTEHVSEVGDVMYDAHLFYDSRAEETSNIMEKLDLSPKGYLLATIHRAENTVNPKRLCSIFKGLTKVADKIPVVLPLHPRTKIALEKEKLLNEISRKLLVVDPVGYFDMLILEKNARLIATDSGGVQKEAYFFNVPCLTLRDQTEWSELVEAGCNLLVGANEEKILKGTKALLKMRRFPSVPRNFYGTGQSGNRILDIICNFLNGKHLKDNGVSPPSDQPERTPLHEMSVKNACTQS